MKKMEKGQSYFDLDDLSRNIINNIELFHPIMFNSHNLCELVSSSKLKVNGKRKKPYIDILVDFVGNCTCKRELLPLTFGS